MRLARRTQPEGPEVRDTDQNHRSGFRVRDASAIQCPGCGSRLVRRVAGPGSSPRRFAHRVPLRARRARICLVNLA